jgi:hypothetical protein
MASESGGRAAQRTRSQHVVEYELQGNYVRTHSSSSSSFFLASLATGACLCRPIVSPTASSSIKGVVHVALVVPGL